MANHDHRNPLTVGIDSFRTTEIEEVNGYLNNHIISHRCDVLASPSNVSFDCRRWHVGEFQVCDFSYGECEVQITLDKCDEDGFFIVVPLHGHADVVFKGERFSLYPGSAMAFTKLDSANTCFYDSSSFRNINISISYKALSDFLINEFDLPITRNISFTKGPVFISNEFQFLLDYIGWISSRFDDGIESMLLNSLHMAQHMEDLLMALLITTIDNNYQELYCSQYKKNASPVYVRLAEEYIRDNAREAVTVNTIAREVGVATRTLHLGFQRYRNYSVSEFLRNERLSQAHKELATGKQKSLSVTDVAYACGFAHLSKFAVAYQKKYGENPSETLKKGI